MTHIPSSFIKNVALEIEGSYFLDNSTFPIREKQRSVTGNFFLTMSFWIRFKKPPVEQRNKIPFVGRNQHVAKFLSFLSSPLKTGVFLVTGYRGMGKTSFVNHVLSEYLAKTDKPKGVKIIQLTIAQTQPKEIDILRLVVMSVFDEFKGFLSGNPWHSIYRVRFFRYLLNLWLLPQVFFVASVFLWRQETIVSFITEHSCLSPSAKIYSGYLNLVVVSALIYLVLTAFVNIRIYWLLNKDTAFNRIRWLVERCASTISEEVSQTEEAGVPVISVKLFNAEKRTKQYPIASTKEMEYELRSFLDKARKDHQLEFIFVFDELDKLDPPVATSYYYDTPETETRSVEKAYDRQIRERKQAIINIITGLKNFFTSSKARFIFIAGREMFDASLADISDRQSPISSIFTYIFNIESLLKEKQLTSVETGEHESSLSHGIETYLKMLLFEPKDALKSNESLYSMASKVYGLKPGDPNKLYFMLQNFATYLTYRSNGSPKKLIKEIHEFIRVIGPDEDPDTNLNAHQTIIYRQSTGAGSRHYLFFNYENQYRIGFINYLYRPFLIQRGRSFKLYGDNLIVSTSYLFDHLLKFHPFAFSLSNLELVPEVLSPNKTPSLREHIRQIIEYLDGTHIREIEIGLFDFKFFSRTLNEITFLSKIFEQESAALNYTLDENYLVKVHVRNRIRELVNTNSQNSPGNSRLSPIAHLGGILGDLHFFDQEYPEAILAYQDAIGALSSSRMYKITMHEFVTLLKNRLKTGLSFERMSSYESALSSYSDNSDDAFRFMAFRLKKGVPWLDDDHYKILKKDQLEDSEQHIDYYSSPLSDLLQIILQSYLAQIFLQEKRSVAGVSELKTCMALGSFLGVSARFLRNTTRNHIIKANAFMHTGNLLYFKNSERMMTKDSLEDILPKEFKENFLKLIEWHAQHLSGEKKPLLSLFMYLLGMKEVMNYSHRASAYFALFKGKNPIPGILELLGPPGKNDHIYRGIYYSYVGNLLSQIGDCLLGTFIRGDDVHKISIEKVFKPSVWDKWNDDSLPDIPSFLLDSDAKEFALQDVFRCYWLSAKYFEQEGRLSGCNFQYRKILYVLKLVLGKEKKDDAKLENFYVMLDRCLVKPLNGYINSNAHFGNYHMENKAEKEKIPKNYARQNISNHAEVREIELLFNYIKLKTSGKPIKEGITELISSYNSISTQYGRIQELDFYVKYLFLKMDLGILSEKGESVSVEDAMEYLYSLLSILQILDIYGCDYWLGYSYLAYLHIQAGDFIKRIKKRETFFNNVEKELAGLLGNGSYASLDQDAHFSKGAEFYAKALRLHNAGDEYKSIIADMLYLEDDFNDSAYHFGAAMDRYMINNRVFALIVQKCEDALEKNLERGEAQLNL